MGQINELKRMLEKKNHDEIWALYGLIESELKERGKIRSGNLTSERGEAVAIDIYKKTPGEPKLQLAPAGTKNVDALSREGKLYQIKTIRHTRITGTFQADDFLEKRFDYLIVVLLDDHYQPIAVLEAPWEIVDRHKRYHKTMKAFNINVTKKFRDECRVVYSRDSSLS
jgi:hypothetical protein